MGGHFRSMFSIFPFILVGASAVPIRFGSSVELRNKYTENRLGMTLKETSKFVFSSRPPFDDGWLWSVYPLENYNGNALKVVKCSERVKLVNSATNMTLGIKGSRVVPLDVSDDSWTVVCRSGEEWTQGQQIHLLNDQHNCYLYSSLSDPVQGYDNKWTVGCGGLNHDGVWEASEGFYLMEPEEEGERNDEL